MKRTLFFICLIEGILVSCNSNVNEDMLEKRQYDWLSEEDKEAASDPNSIIGIWELYAVNQEIDILIPSKSQDLFCFLSNGRVKVVRNNDKYPCILKTGDFGYFYDKEKKILKIDGYHYQCIISDAKMNINLVEESVCDWSTYKFRKTR